MVAGFRRSPARLPLPACAQMLHLTSSSLCVKLPGDLLFFFFPPFSLLISSQLGSYKPVSSKLKPGQHACRDDGSLHLLAAGVSKEGRAVVVLTQPCAEQTWGFEAAVGELFAAHGAHCLPNSHLASLVQSGRRAGRRPNCFFALQLYCATPFFSAFWLICGLGGWVFPFSRDNLASRLSWLE